MTKEEIIKIAEDLAEKYNSEGLSPFPFDKIQKDKGDIEITLASEKAIDRPNVSGGIFFDTSKEKFFIFINQDKPLERQHFTTAHEIGHYFLHQDIIKSKTIIIDGEDSLDGSAMLYRSDIGIATNIEKEANNFAAVLIMPARFVRRAWEALKNVEECAKVFNVSVSAMAIRLEKLNILKT